MTVDPPPPDPGLEAQKQQAEADQLAALQDKLKGDTASLMSHYGVLSSLGGVVPGSGTTSAAGLLGKIMKTSPGVGP